MTDEIKDEKAIWTKWWFWVVAVFVVIIIGSMDGGEKKETSPEQQLPEEQTQLRGDSQSQQQEQKEFAEEPSITAKTPKEIIEEKFIQILGEKANMREKRIKQINIYTYDYINDYQNVDIEYMADENFTSEMIKQGMWIDAMEVLEELPSVLSTQVMKLTLNPHLTLIDQYGGESIEKVMTIRITREIWEKINWNNFAMDNIPKIAETYWEHLTLGK